MAVGRISGPLLKANLERNGIDLAVETSLLYIDVNNGRIGINTTTPHCDLDVNGTICSDRIDTNFLTVASNYNIGNVNITSTVGNLELQPATEFDRTVIQGDLEVTGSIIGYQDGFTIADDGSTTAFVGLNTTLRLSDGDDMSVVISTDGTHEVVTFSNTSTLDSITSRGNTTLNSISVSNIDGDLQGSVFGDDSTLLVDGVNNKIVGQLEVSNPIINGTITSTDSSPITIGQSLVVSDDLTVENNLYLNNPVTLPAGTTLDGNPISTGDFDGDFNSLTNIPTTLSGYGITDAAFINGPFIGDLQGSVFADDSTLLVDGVSGTIPSNVIVGTLNNNLIGNVTGNLVGNVDGDLQGSVFGDDSTLIVDGINNSVIATSVTTPQIVAATTLNINTGGDFTVSSPANIQMNATSGAVYIVSPITDLSGILQVSTIDSADSSAITFVPSVTFESDVAVQNDLNVANTVTASQFIGDGSQLTGLIANFAALNDTAVNGQAANTLIRYDGALYVPSTIIEDATGNVTISDELTVTTGLFTPLIDTADSSALTITPSTVFSSDVTVENILYLNNPPDFGTPVDLPSGSTLGGVPIGTTEGGGDADTLNLQPGSYYLDAANLTGNVPADFIRLGIDTVGGFVENIVGTVNEIEITGDSTTESATLTVGLPDNVTIGNELTVTTGLFTPLIDTADSSALTITPATTFSSDVTVENDLIVTNKITASVYYGDGSNLTGISTTTTYADLTDTDITGRNTNSLTRFDGINYVPTLLSEDASGNVTIAGQLNVNTIDTADSSAITITPAVIFSSDITVENDLVVTNKVSAAEFIGNGSQLTNINANNITSGEILLGTRTSGNYVATITGTANEVEVIGSGSETAAVTIGLPNDVTIGNELTVTTGLFTPLIDTADSSALTITPSTVFSSDVTVENDLVVTNKITATAYYGDGSNLTGISTTTTYADLTDTDITGRTTNSLTRFDGANYVPTLLVEDASGNITVSGQLNVSTIDTADSSAITITPAAVFSSDVTIENDLILNGKVQGPIDVDGNLTINGAIIVTNENDIFLNGGDVILSSGSQVTMSDDSTRDKYRVWDWYEYAIGMTNGNTFGGLNNDFAMTFNMANDNDTGFWWGDSAQTNAQGAMALTTNGKLTVAHSVRIGYGEADTTIPGATYAFDVNGDASINGNVIISGQLETSTIDTSDSSAITITPAAIFSSDVTVENDLYVNNNIRGDDLKLQSTTSETYLTATLDGAVSLYYDNSQKLSTYSSGVTINDTLQTPNIQTDVFELGYSNYLPGTMTGTISNGSNVLFKTQPPFAHAGSVTFETKRFALTTTENNHTILETSSSRFPISASDESSIKLYADDVERLATTSIGVTITGQLSVSTIDTADSSAITITPAAIFSSDVTVENDLNVNNDVIISGNLTVQGTTTQVDSNVVNIGDSIITLNSDEVGAPTQNAGIEVERGTSANVQFIWNESTDKWQVTEDGATYYNILTNQGNQVALGTDTTGDYIATITGTANEVEVTGSGGETAAVTIGLPDDITIGGELTVTTGLFTPLIDTTDSSALTITPATTFSSDVTVENNFVVQTDALYVSSNGEVGIGTTSITPGSKLDVEGTITAELIALDAQGAQSSEPRYIKIGGGRTATGDSYIDLIGSGTYADYGARFVRYGGTQDTQIRHRGTGTLLLATDDAGDFRVDTNNIERMRIKSDGKVGIGTTAPETFFHVDDQDGTGPTVIFEGGGTNTDTPAAGEQTLFLKTGSGTGDLSTGIGFWGTFESFPGDTSNRRAADIRAGFDGGTWGNEYISFHVGVGSGSANDAAAMTDERLRITNSEVTSTVSLDITGDITSSGTLFVSTIDTTDSSALTITPSAVFSSDVTVENVLYLNNPPDFGSPVDLPSGSTLGGVPIGTTEGGGDADTLNGQPGSYYLDGANLTGSLPNDYVTLGTDTTGNYVATISGTANEVEVTGSGSETAAVTIGLPNDVTISNELTVTTGLFTPLIDTADSSALTITPAAIFSSDVTVENDLVVTNKITATEFVGVTYANLDDVDITGRTNNSLTKFDGANYVPTLLQEYSNGDLRPAKDIEMLDNQYIVLGGNRDLWIFSDGTTGIIQSPIEPLKIRVPATGTSATADGLIIQSTTNETLASFLPNYGVYLYFDDVLRLQTTPAGITVHGDITQSSPSTLSYSTLSTSTIDSLDSSAVTIVPAAVFNSDVTVENDLVVTNKVTATEYYGDGSNLTGISTTTTYADLTDTDITGRTTDSLTRFDGANYVPTAMSEDASGNVTIAGQLNIGTIDTADSSAITITPAAIFSSDVTVENDLVVTNKITAAEFIGDGSQLTNIDVNNIPGLQNEFVNLSDTDVAGQTANTLIKYNGVNYVPTQLNEDSTGNITVGGDYIEADEFVFNSVLSPRRGFIYDGGATDVYYRTGGANSRNTVTFGDGGLLDHALTLNGHLETNTKIITPQIETSTIDTSDSSAITITPAAIFSSDVTVENDLNVTNDVIISGNLTVQGTTTQVDSNVVNIGDSIITLNSDETGTPTQNAGIEVERGTSANVQFIWNESTDKWQVTEDGATYYNILTNAGDQVALGTDTTGDYVATITGTANEVEVTGSGSETAAVTIGLPNDVTIANELTVTTGLFTPLIDTADSSALTITPATTFSSDVTVENILYLNNPPDFGAPVDLPSGSTLGGVAIGTTEGGGDADTLNGQPGSYYLNAANLTGNVPADFIRLGIDTVGGFVENIIGTANEIEITSDSTTESATLTVGLPDNVTISNELTVTTGLFTPLIDTADSSALTITPATTFSSDVTVENDLVVTNKITATAYYGDGSNLTGISTTTTYAALTDTDITGRTTDSLTRFDGVNYVPTAMSEDASGNVTISGQLSVSTIDTADSSAITVTPAAIFNSDVTVENDLNVTNDVIISGNLTVQGTTTQVDSNVVNIGDSIITLNADETGAPTQNAGIEVERGTSANVQFIWNESTDKWQVTEDGTIYYNILTNAGDQVALGSDTTGDYVATISGTANEVEVIGSGSETAAVTIGLPDNVTIANELTVTTGLFTPLIDTADSSTLTITPTTTFSSDILVENDVVVTNKVTASEFIGDGSQLTNINANNITSGEIPLGTRTSGNYVATISGTANEVEVIGSGSETAAVTIGLPDNVTIGGELTVTTGLFTPLIDTADSSALTITPATTFSSDVTVENILYLNNPPDFGAPVDLPSGSTLGGVPIGTTEGGGDADTLNLQPGSYYLDAANLTGNVPADFIRLGIDTIGGFVENIVGTANEIEITGDSTTESATLTVGLPDNVTIGNELTVTTGLFTPLIDTADSSALTITPAAVFNSDVTVENDLNVTNDVTADRFFGDGSGLYNVNGLATIVGRTEEFPTVTDGSPTVTMSSAYDIDALDVFLNGVRLRPSTDYTVSGTDLTFNENLTLNDTVAIYIFKYATKIEEFPTVVNGSADVTLGDTYSLSQLDVYLNGSKLKPTTDFTLAGTTLTFSNTLVTDDIVSVIVYSEAIIGGGGASSFVDLLDTDVAGQATNTLIRYNGNDYVPTATTEDASGNVTISGQLNVSVIDSTDSSSIFFTPAAVFQSDVYVQNDLDVTNDVVANAFYGDGSNLTGITVDTNFVDLSDTNVIGQTTDTLIKYNGSEYVPTNLSENASGDVTVGSKLNVSLIDSADSSTITVTPAVQFQSDIIVDNDVKVTNNLNINDIQHTVANAVTYATTAASSITNFPGADFSSGNIIIQVKDNVTSQVQICKISIVHDTSTVSTTEYSNLYTGGVPLATFTGVIRGGYVHIDASGASNNSTTYKVVKTLLKFI